MHPTLRRKDALSAQKAERLELHEGEEAQLAASDGGRR
jgi:hypothetical protein